MLPGLSNAHLVATAVLGMAHYQGYLEGGLGPAVDLPRVLKALDAGVSTTREDAVRWAMGLNRAAARCAGKELTLGDAEVAAVEKLYGLAFDHVVSVVGRGE